MRQWRWTWFGAGLVVFSILIVAGLRGRYLAGEQGVAAWKREMRAKGEKLLVADLAPAPVQADPIAPVLARELKGLPNAPLLSGGPSAMSLTAPGIARVSWKSRASADQWQAWIDQLDKASDELANMRAAIASPSRDLGWGYQNYSAYPSHTLIDFRKSAYWLANATILELHRDNRAAALTNLLALLNLAQCYEQEMTLVWQMIRVAIVRMAVSTTWEALQSDGWTEDDLKALQSSWNRVQLGRSLEPAIQMERAIALSYFEKAKKGDTNGTSVLSSGMDFYSPVWKIALSQQDELNYLAITQEVLETMRAAAAARSAGSFASHMRSLTNRPSTVIGKFLHEHRYPMSHATLINFSRAVKTWMRAETERQMVTAAIVLERYRLRHHAYPEQLKDLTPELLSEIAVDYMDGKPLRYRRIEGRFLLYSVGEDGIDQGGSVGGTNTPASIWEGPDVIWPRRAE